MCHAPRPGGDQVAARREAMEDSVPTHTYRTLQKAKRPWHDTMLHSKNDLFHASKRQAGRLSDVALACARRLSLHTFASLRLSLSQISFHSDQQWITASSLRLSLSQISFHSDQHCITASSRPSGANRKANSPIILFRTGSLALKANGSHSTPSASPTKCTVLLLCASAGNHRLQVTSRA